MLPQRVRQERAQAGVPRVLKGVGRGRGARGAGRHLRLRRGRGEIAADPGQALPAGHRADGGAAAGGENARRAAVQRARLHRFLRDVVVIRRFQLWVESGRIGQDSRYWVQERQTQAQERQTPGQRVLRGRRRRRWIGCQVGEEARAAARGQDARRG